MTNSRKTDAKAEIARLNKKFNKRLTLESYQRLLREVEAVNKKFFLEAPMTVDQYLEGKRRGIEQP
jgi:hypothetical protein